MNKHKKKDVSSEIAPYCVCSRCGLKVPYISRRYIAVEDKNSNVVYFGKPTKLIDLCVECLKEIYSDQQVKTLA